MAIAVGKVLDVTGVVQVLNKKTGDIRQVSEGAEIFHNEVILTADNASISVDMINGTTVALGSDSIFTIDNDVIPAAAIENLVSDNAVTFESIQQAVLAGNLDSVVQSGQTFTPEQTQTLQARVDALKSSVEQDEELSSSSQEGVQDARDAAQGLVTAGYDTAVENPVYIREQDDTGRDQLFIVPKLDLSGMAGTKTVIEGETAYYTITLDQVPSSLYTLTVKVSHLDTDDGDLDANTMKVVFQPGQTTAKFEIVTKDDFLSEGPERFSIQVVDAEGGNFGGKPTFPPAFITTIISNTSTEAVEKGGYGPEDTIYIQLSGDARVEEDEGAELTHKITLVDADGNPVDLPVGESITITLKYADGVGMEDADFIDGKRVTEFTIVGNGGSEYDFTNYVTDDYLNEGEESYTVSIESIKTPGSYFENVEPHGTVNSAKGTIIDGVDDLHPNQPEDTVYVRLTGNDTTLEADGNKLTHTITLVDKDGVEVILPDGKSIEVELTYTSTDGITNDDFSSKVQTVTITGSPTENVITTKDHNGSKISNQNGSVVNTVEADGVYEGTETYTLTVGTLTDTNSVFENLEKHPDHNSVTGTIYDLQDDAKAVKEDESVNADGEIIVTGNVLTNDSVGIDPDAVVTLEANAEPKYGDLVINEDGSYTYTLDNGTDGKSSSIQNLNVGDTLTDTFTYKVTLPNGDTATAKLVVTINGTNDAPVITLDSDDSSKTGNAFDYKTQFKEGSAAISIGDTDTIVTDIDNTNIVSATIVLTNAQTGDILNTPTIAGLTFATDTIAGKVTVTITGSKTLAEYQEAIKAITFENQQAEPNETPRVIEVTVNDGQALNKVSNTATTTITVSAKPIISTTIGEVKESYLVKGTTSGTDGEAVAASLKITESFAITKKTAAITDLVFNEDETTTLLNNLGMKSKGVDLVYTFDSDYKLIATAGGVDVFTLTINNPTDSTGQSQSYTFELQGTIDHALNVEGGLFQDFPFAYTLKDSNFDIEQEFVVKVVDDVVIAVDDDKRSAVEGSGTELTGNVLDNDLGADQGFKIYDFKYIDKNDASQTFVFGTKTTKEVKTPAGTLTVNSDGSWKFVADKAVNNDTDSDKGSFQYRVIDEDGDISVSAAYATQPIEIKDFILQVAPIHAVVDEQNLINPIGAGNSEGADARTAGDIYKDDKPGVTSKISLGITSVDEIADVKFALSDLDNDIVGLTSSGVPIYYTLSADGHTLTAQVKASVGAARKVSDETVFTVTLHDTASKDNASYEFTLLKPIDHEAGLGRNLKDLDFKFNVIDIDYADGLSNLTKDTSLIESFFTVTVIDSIPFADDQAVEMDEFGSIYKDGTVVGGNVTGKESLQINLSESVSGDGSINIANNAPDSNGAKTAYSKDDVIQMYATGAAAGDAPIGTLTNNGDGTLTFTPKPYFSGEVVFGYSVTDSDGDSATGQMTVTVNPVASGVDMQAHVTVTALEDNNNTVTTQTDFAIALGLELPKVIDKVDHTATAYDAIERQGLLVFTFSNVGDKNDGYLVGLDTNSDGKLDDTKFIIGTDENSFKVYITDGDFHPTNLDTTGAIHLTKAQYAQLAISPVLNSHHNVDFTISTESHEVTDLGALLSTDVKSVTSTQNVTVDLHAVTDPVSIELTAVNTADTTVTLEDRQAADGTPGTDGVNDHINLTINEDVNDGLTYVNLKDIIIEKYGDLDGSENFWFEITSAANDGVKINVQGVGSKTISTTTQKFDFNHDDPFIRFTPPKNFSGDLSLITIKLVALDSDSDSPTAVIKEESDFITLSVFVNPIADKASLPNVNTKEDTPVKLFEKLAVNDKDGSEIITKVEISNVPAGWVLKDQGGTVLLTGNGSTGHTITIDGTLITLANVKEYTVTPPAHSSKDITLPIKVTVVDTVTVNGNSVTDEKVFDHVLNITVSPVAERTDTNSNELDNDVKNDLTINPNHTYELKALEDGDDVNNPDAPVWFKLGTDTGFNLKDNWSNEDNTGLAFDPSRTPSQFDSEQTYALLTFMDLSGKAISGALYRYKDSDNNWVEKTDLNGRVEIPALYLNTLEMIAPPHQAGDFKIKVEAKTIDYGEDQTDTPHTAISGESYLYFGVEPVADQLTLQVAQAVGNEDAGRVDGNDTITGSAVTPESAQGGIKLKISPTSDDKNETFNITIAAISDGATISYDGVLFNKDTVTGASDKVKVTAMVDEDNAPVLDEDGKQLWQLEIENFEEGKTFFIPPHNSSGVHTLKISGQSVDVVTVKGDEITSRTDLATFLPLDLDVVVRAKADLPVNDELVFVDVTDSENNVHKDVFNAVASEDNSTDGKGASINLKTIFATPDDLDVYDSSETLSIKVTGLGVGFNISGEGVSLLGGTGEDRVWSIDIQSLKDDKAELITPEHFAGVIDFTLNLVTTEATGDSRTHGAKPVKILVTPVVEDDAKVQEGDVQYEDIAKALEFDLITKDKGDIDSGKETITAFSIDVTDLAVGVTLYTGATINADGTVTGGTELTGANAVVELKDGKPDVIAVLKEDSHIDGGYEFKISYTITDTATDGTNSYIANASLVDKTYKVTVHSVTDDVGLVMGAGSETVSKTDTTFTKTLKVSSKDQDGSEQFTKIIVSGVPEGISVKDGVLSGPSASGNYSGVWEVNVKSKNLNITSDAATYDLEFQLDSGATFPALNVPYEITVTVFNEDIGNPAGLNGSETFASEKFDLNIDPGLSDGGGQGEPYVVKLEQVSDQLTEDTEFNLSDYINVDTGHLGGAFSITLTDIPVGVTVKHEGESITADGDGKYIISGTGNQQAVIDLLQSITITPKKDHNTKFGDETTRLDFGVELVSPGRADTTKVDFKGTVLPVTDKLDLTVSDNTVAGTGEGQERKFTVKIDNQADGASTEIIDGKVYLKVVEDYADLGQETGANKGVLKDSTGDTLEAVTVTGVPGLADGQYYVIENVGYVEGLELDFTFTPVAHRDGEVTVDVYVQNREDHNWQDHPTDTKLSHKEIKFTVAPVVDGFTVDPLKDVTGVEDELISLDLALSNPDASEKLTAMLIENIPNGFLVFYGDVSDPAQAKQAKNMGVKGSVDVELEYGVSESVSANFWSVPIVNGELPAYVWVKAPENWSGTLTDVKIKAVDQDGNVSPQDNTININVTPVADGIKIKPTNTFGQAGDDIAIRLNATLLDLDGSEAVTLTLKGLGVDTTFKVDGVSIDTGLVTYVEATDTYTLTGLPAAGINDLTFNQVRPSSGDVTVTAKTVERGNSDESAVVDATFTFNLSTREATSGDDVIYLAHGKNGFIDGGAGNDFLYGGDGNDFLYGGDGNDFLYGGDGDDVLIGGKGLDTLTGGAGNDVFKIASDEDSQDIITDFNNTTEQDKLDLSEILNIQSGLGLDDYLKFDKVGNDQVVKIYKDGDANATGAIESHSVLLQDGKDIEIKLEDIIYDS